MSGQNIRFITDVERRYNELPTQLRYHMMKMERTVVELAETGSIGGGEGPTLSEQISTIRDASDTNAANIASLNTSVTSLSNSVSGLSNDVASINANLNSSPTANKTLQEWASQSETRLDNLDTSITSITDEQGDKAGLGFASSDTLWGAIKTNQDDISTLGTGLTALTASVTSNTNVLASSPTANKTLQEWATIADADIDALQTDVSTNASDITALENRVTSAEALLNDLTVGW